MGKAWFQGPLAGVKVVEFAGIGPGPFCAMLLSDMGCDVVRIDRAGARGGGAANVTNRGRRSIALDLKSDADIALVFANIDLSLKHKGITCFIVPADTPGYSHGTHEFKLGVNASGTTELAFENMRIPARWRLGGEGEGFKVAMATLDGGRIGIAAQAIGIAQAAFEEALAYAQQREQFNQHLSDFQAIQFYLADMAT